MADMQSQCPHKACKAKGVRIDDNLVIDGLNVGGVYCGKCGRNWPYEAILRDNERRQQTRLTSHRTGVNP